MGGMDGERISDGEIRVVRALLRHRLVVLLVRVFLGGLFVIAGLDKITDPAGFAQSILNYRLLSPTLALAAATVIPWMELLCGLGLLLGLYPRGSSLLAAGMLLIFTILVGVAMARGLDIACGCFSQDPEVGRIGWMKILDNTGLFLLGLISLYARPEISLVAWLRRDSASTT